MRRLQFRLSDLCLRLWLAIPTVGLIAAGGSWVSSDPPCGIALIVAGELWFGANVWASRNRSRMP
jgi:hypothetical protein